MDPIKSILAIALSKDDSDEEFTDEKNTNSLKRKLIGDEEYQAPMYRFGTRRKNKKPQISMFKIETKDEFDKKIKLSKKNKNSKKGPINHNKTKVTQRGPMRRPWKKTPVKKLDIGHFEQKITDDAQCISPGRNETAMLVANTSRIRNHAYRIEDVLSGKVEMDEKKAKERDTKLRTEVGKCRKSYEEQLKKKLNGAMDDVKVKKSRVKGYTTVKDVINQVIEDTKMYIIERRLTMVTKKEAIDTSEMRNIFNAFEYLVSGLWCRKNINNYFYSDLLNDIEFKKDPCDSQ